LSLAGKFNDMTSDMQGAHPGAHLHAGTVSGHAPADAIVIPDAHLLFTGDFKRAGVDLVVSGDGHEVVLHDYFKGEKRAALASPDGAHLTGDIINALTGHTQFAQADGSASVAQVIGHVTKLTGTATVIRNGVSIILNQGDNVNKGDVVASGSDSTLGITFIDGTVFGLASNAKMVLNEMIYDPNGSDNKSLISLVQGTISFVAGATAKHGDMKVDTPVATMGIRGTAVLVEIDFTVPANGGAPPASFQVLVEPDGTTGSYILFDKTTLTPIATVNQAGTQTIVNGQGTVNFLSSAQLSADAQKIITDVFALKFSDLNNPNTKLTTNFTDSIVPQTTFVKLASGDPLIVTLLTANPGDKTADPTKGGNISGRDHIPGPPEVVTHNGATTEHTLTTGSAAIDSVTGTVAYADINPGDVPTVKTAFTSYTYQNAAHTDVTATLTGEQLAAIKAVEAPLTVVQDPTSLNHGVANWTYSIADSAFDFLAAGEVLTLTYTAHVDNNFLPNNEFKESTFTITITGANDTPTITTSGNTITERVGSGNTAVDTATGTVTFTDVDLTDRPIVSAALSATHPFQYLDANGHDITASLTPEQLAAIAAVESPLTVVQALGNTHNGSATWTYSVVDSAFDFLAKGEILTLNYVAQVDDGHGGVISTPITVSINGADVSVTGTNDVPTIVPGATTATGAMTEDTAATLTADGTITFQDLDLTDTHTAAFVLKSSDASANLPGYSEAAPLSQIGTFALTAITESPGTSTFGSVGWNFTLADNDPVLQSLAKDQTITQVYTVTITDNNGAPVTQDVTVTITGTNDTPTITSNAAAAAGAVTEDASTPDLTTSGTLQIQDLDLIDTHTAGYAFSTSSSSAHLPGFTEGSTHIGIFSIDPAVTESTTDTDNHATLGWHFTLNDNDPVLQSLAVNQTITQVYTVTFTDNNGATVTQDVTVVIHGTNDAPVITSNAAAATGAVTEDANTPNLTTSGTLQIQDLDLIDSHTATVAFSTSSSSVHLPGFSEGTTNLGTFSIDPSVTESTTDTDNHATLGWSFTLNDNDPVLQSLAVNQSITQIYRITFSDGHGGTVNQDVTVVIHGTNDAPVITSNAAAAAGAATEDANTPNLTTSGTLQIQDLDLIDSHTATAAFSTSSSSVHLPGFSEGTTNLGTFSIDPSVTESTTDTDNHATLGWSFTLNDNDPMLQSLAVNQSITQIYRVTFSDGHGGTVNQDVTVVIHGTNDAPVITSNAAAATGAVTEDANTPDLTTSGTLQIQDLDLIDSHTAGYAFSTSSSSAHLPGFTEGSTHIGTFSIDPAVTESKTDTNDHATLGWTFTLDDNDPMLQSLAKGQTITQVYTVTFTDNNGAIVTQDVTVKITGTNDKPVLAADTVASHAITEQPGLTGAPDATVDTTSGSLTFTDVDLTDTHVVSHDTPTYAWSGGALITAQTDALTAASTLALHETDSTGSGAGSVAFDYSAADHSFDFLAAGQTLTVTYDITVADYNNGVANGTSSVQPVTITIHGTNDLATITATTAGSDAGTVAEDGTLTISGALTVADVDSGENHFQTPSTLAGTYGSFTFNAGTGLWGYTLNNAAANVQALTGTTVVHDTLTVTSADGTDSHVIDVTIHGTNDLATITATTAGSDAGTVMEDGTLTANGALTVADVDSGESHFQTPSTLAGTYGSFTFNTGTGLWGYALNNAAANVQALTGTTVVHDTLTVKSADGTGSHVIDVTIHGTNDAATITATTAGSDTGTVTEDGTLTISGALTVTDVDSGESHFQTPSTLAGTYGSFTFNTGTGLWGYALNDAAANVQALTGTDVVHDTLTVKSADGTASHVVNVTIHGANDAPSIVGETNAPAQAVMVAPTGITVLAAGVTTNAFGLNTETFDGQTVGHRSFHSTTLGADFNGTGSSQVFHGTVDGVSAAPFVGPLPGAADTTNYFSVGGGATETISFATEQNAFGLYWGSVDSYNTISFYDGLKLVASYSGANVAPLLSNGNQGSFASNGYVEFSGLGQFNKVVLGSTSNAFELDNVSAGAIHSTISASVSGTLSVHDADIGDTLTASVIENGTAQFTGANHSTQLPNGVNISALLDSHDITFDTVQSNGGTAVLDWTYHPTSSNLDFLKAGDVLKLTFNAQVSDGHGHTANQALTVELDGANSATNTSAFKVVEGTTANDTFNNVGGGATVFGNGGQDTFVFKPGFGSATIADFDAHNDVIEINKSLFANLADVIAHSQAVNSDLVITDGTADTITLKGIAANQLHDSNFHLV
jgi:VCBS repeat-containing protein